jgi:hypothetical protein
MQKSLLLRSDPTRSLRDLVTGLPQESLVATSGRLHAGDRAPELVGDVGSGAGVDVGGEPGRVVQIGEAGR